MVAEVIVFVGLQAAGKSTYYRNNFAATHVHVSKDLMKNVRDRDARQLQLIAQAIGAGQSVVVDNTNPTPVARAPVIALARKLSARAVAYYFEAVVKDAVARNRLREGRERVPDVAIYVSAKKLVPPSLEEGFDEIHVVAPIAP